MLNRKIDTLVPTFHLLERNQSIKRFKKSRIMSRIKSRERTRERERATNKSNCNMLNMKKICLHLIYS
jgi:hypothetical protein